MGRSEVLCFRLGIPILFAIFAAKLIKRQSLTFSNYEIGLVVVGVDEVLVSKNSCIKIGRCFIIKKSFVVISYSRCISYFVNVKL